MNARVFGLVPVVAPAGTSLEGCDADVGRRLFAAMLQRLASALTFEHFYVAVPSDTAQITEALSAVTARVELLRCAGVTRVEMVRSALELLRLRARGDDWVLLHDPQWPCVPVSAVRRLMSELRDDPIGGLLAAPMADTLKRADGESGSGDPARVLRTEDRRALWHAQTPRVFRFAGLARALEVTAASTAIDELEALEMLAASGDIAQPRLIAGSPLNVRVRDRAGATLALAILRAQDQGDTQTAAA